MGSVYIVRRETRTKGTRWHVRYQAHRRAPAILLGVFDTEARALLRRETALDELARNEEPTRAPKAKPQTTSVGVAAQAWLSSVDDSLAERTLKNYRRTIRELPTTLASLDPLIVTHLEIQRYVDALKKTKARATIEREVVVLRSVFDYAGCSPNPASDRRVKLPRKNRKEYRLPSRADIAELHAALPDRVPLMLLLEHTGLRIQEAASLVWGDFDTPRNRLLVREGKTTSARRWVDHLPGTPPFPIMEGVSKLPEPFFRPSPLSFTAAIWHAHKQGRCPMFSAHDFRHLHASRLLHEGTLSPAQIAARLGHANPGVTLGTYSHVVPPD